MRRRRSPLNGRNLLISGAAVLTIAGAVTAFTVGAADQPERSADLAAQIDPSTPRNVILLIGDGTDDSIITAARNYELGAGGRFPALDSLPFTGDMTTHGLKTGTGPDYPIAYVSDSAPTASAWSTGRKTVDGRLSQGPSTADTVPGEDYETVLEILRDRGKRTGNVSTAEITDATPAAAASHINARACQGPADMAACVPARKSNGGRGSVAEQLVDNRIDVILGGGRNRYVQATDAGPTVLDYARDTVGYRYIGDPGAVSTAGDLDAITSLDDGPVIGLFTNGNMTPRYEPLVATAPPGAGGPTQICTPANRGTQPTLEQMTAKAIELLDNEDGFFLQVESAMVDKQEHASDICGAIGDVGELDRALQVALDYQDENPDTLIIVTSDHAHSTQIVPSATSGKQTATLLTADGDPMYVAYSTQDSGSSHTGTQVRVAAKGPQAANVTGLIDQTDLFSIMLGREPSELPVNAVTETVTVTAPGPSTTVEVPTTVTAPPVTVTAPGVTTTVPAPPARGTPRVSVSATGWAIRAGDLRRGGLRVAVAAQGATRVQATLVQKGRTIARTTVAGRGGSITLRTARVPSAGVAQLRIVATGSGGEAQVTKRVVIR